MPIYIAIKLVRVTQNIYSLRPIKNITCPWKQNFENVFEWANRAKRVKIFSSLESDQMISFFVYRSKLLTPCCIKILDQSLASYWSVFSYHECASLLENHRQVSRHQFRSSDVFAARFGEENVIWAIQLIVHCWKTSRIIERGFFRISPIAFFFSNRSGLIYELDCTLSTACWEIGPESSDSSKACYVGMTLFWPMRVGMTLFWAMRVGGNLLEAPSRTLWINFLTLRRNFENL